MRYESFTVHFGPAPAGSFAVSVRSPQGEGRGALTLLPSGLALRPEEGPDRGRLAGSPRGVPGLSPPRTRDPGADLFQALFRDEVANLFHASLGGLRDRDQGLRIDISIDPRQPELAGLQLLPWERLCRPETGDVFGLSRHTPVVRSLEAPRERRPAIAAPRRLRILVVAASPTGLPPLDLAREVAHLEEAWKGQEREVEFVFLRKGGVDEMRRAFLASPFHILHFMGHGTFDGESGQGALVFERHDGTGHPFEGRHLAQLLRDFATLRLVVLNACHTAEAVGFAGADPFAGTATSLVMGGVPAVVAMSGPVSDPAAVAFSRVFYQRLAMGDAIEAAVTEGRLAIQRVEPEDEAWAKPVLFLRSEDGRLFAPPSETRLRRASLGLGSLAALGLLLALAGGWRKEHRASSAARLTHQGIGFLELNQPEKAREALRAAVDLRPDDAVALGNLAVVEQQLGDEAQALAHAEAAVRAAPDEAVHRYNLGNLLAAQRRYEEAIESLRRAIAIDPGYATAYNELGNVYLDLERPAEARRAFEAGLRKDPKLARLHKNLARTALAEGHPPEAIDQLAKALPLYDPADATGRAEATYWMAAARARAGQRAGACAALRDLQALDPLSLGPYAKEAALLAERNGCAR